MIEKIQLKGYPPPPNTNPKEHKYTMVWFQLYVPLNYFSPTLHQRCVIAKIGLPRCLFGRLHLSNGSQFACAADDKGAVRPPTSLGAFLLLWSRRISHLRERGLGCSAGGSGALGNYYTLRGCWPSKHGPLIQCCFVVGPTSKTAGQQQNNIGSTARAPSCANAAMLWYLFVWISFYDKPATELYSNT